MTHPDTLQRAAFEDWAKSKSLNTDHKEKNAWGHEEYLPHIESMWMGWQAALQPQAAAEPVNEWTMIAPDGTRFTGPTPLKAAMPASKYRLEIDPVAAERFMAVVEQERQAGERENLECMAKYGTLDCPYCGGSGHIGDVMSVGGIVACSYPSCGCTGEGEPCRAEAQNDLLLSTPPATQSAPVSLQPAHDSITVNLLNDRVMRQQAALTAALEVADTLRHALSNMLQRIPEEERSKWLVVREGCDAKLRDLRAAMEQA